jgi:hypothetical protein
MRRRPPPGFETFDGAPVRAAMGGCRRVVMLGFVLMAILITVAILGAGPLLQILLNILLSSY